VERYGISSETQQICLPLSLRRVSNSLRSVGEMGEPSSLDVFQQITQHSN